MKPAERKWKFLRWLLRAMSPSDRIEVRAALDGAEKDAESFVAETVAKAKEAGRDGGPGRPTP